MTKTDVPADWPMVPATSVAPPVAPSIDSILATAVESGRSPEELGRLLDVYERMKTIQREAEFNEAFARFQAECPTIRRDRQADIVTKSGSKFGYSYASLDEIERVILPVLTKHGFSRSYDSKVDGANLLVVCRLSHRSGHSREACFPCPTESTGAMSAAQKYGAALTYARRQSFVSVCGLSVGDPDVDGADDGGEPPKRITVEQVRSLQDFIIEVGADLTKLKAYFKVQAIDELTEDQLEAANRMLEQRRIANAKGKP